MTISKNPYLYGLAQSFKMAYSKREKMEQNFNSDMLDEFTEINENVAQIAGDLIKCGIDVYYYRSGSR